MTIGTLAARIMADASGIKSGMGLTRDELKLTRQAFIDSQTDADKLNTALKLLEQARGKGAFKDEEQYARAVAKVREQLDPAAAAARQFAAAKKDAGAPQLADGLKQIGQNAANAIPGVSGLTNTLSLGHPVLIGAAVAVGGLVVAYKAARAAVDWYTEGVSKSLEEIDKMSKEARTLGTTVQDLRELRFAFGEIAGLDTGQTDKALERLSKAIGQANAGGKEQQAVFKALKLDSEELARVGTAEAMRQLAGAMQSIEAPTERVRIATKLFGREGAEVINVLAGGREAIDASAEAVSRYAGVISDLDAAQVEATNDAWGRVSMALAGLTEQAAVKLAPALQVAAERVLDILDPQTQTGQSIALALEVVPPLLAKIIDLADILIGKFQQQQIRVMELANVAVQATATIDAALAYATPGYEASEDLKAWAADYQRQIDVATKDAAERISRGFSGGTAKRMQELAAEAKKAFDASAGAGPVGSAIEDQEKLAAATTATANAFKFEGEVVTDFEDILGRHEIVDPLGKALQATTAYIPTMGEEFAQLYDDIISEQKNAGDEVDKTTQKIAKQVSYATSGTIEAGSMASAFDAIRKAKETPAIIDRFAGIGEPVPVKAAEKQIPILERIAAGIQAMIAKENITIEEVSL